VFEHKLDYYYVTGMKKNFYLKLFLFLFIPLLATISIFSANNAFAADPNPSSPFFSRVDLVTIQEKQPAKTITYTDSTLEGVKFVRNNDPDGCKDFITSDSNFVGSSPSYYGQYFWLVISTKSGAECSETVSTQFDNPNANVNGWPNNAIRNYDTKTQKPVFFTPTGVAPGQAGSIDRASFTTYFWVDSSTIQRIGLRSSSAATFKQDSADKSKFITNDTCGSFITVKSDTTGIYTAGAQGGGNKFFGIYPGGSGIDDRYIEVKSNGSLNNTCSSSNIEEGPAKERLGLPNDNKAWISIGRPDNRKIAAGTGTPITPINTDEASGAGTSSCEVEGIGWILCPVINFLASVADVAFSFLADNFLEFKSGTLDVGGNLFKAWSQVLTFANVGLVIFFLIIIFSQITGFGITNYGIKKMLPRLVIVAILMNLSFFLVQIAADVSNILGYSFKNFFSGILQTSNDFQQCVDSGNVGYIGGNCSSGLGVAAAGILAGGAAGGAVARVGGVSAALVILIPILLSAVIALLIIFLILVLRQVLLILLTVIAPIAFLAFLLPNTEGWFKKWYKTLTALLLVFPIIGIIYGLSSFASEILISTGVGSDSTLQQLIGAATLVLPLFLVPVILKKSLDSIPAIAGKVGSIGSKVTGSAKNSAKQGMEKSYIGQKAAYNKNQAAIRRAQIQSGTYAGGGIRGLGSKAFGALNRGRWSGEFGDSMLAKGAALELEERSKRDKEADALIKAIDREERKNIANTGLDSRGRRANDAVRRAALRDFASKATLEEAHELIGNVGSMSGEQRSDLVSSLQTNAVVSSAPYMDATFLSEVRSGTRLVTGSNGQTTWDWVGSISDAARRGSVNASSLASASEEAIKELNSNLDASSRAIVQQQRDTAKSDPRLSVAIAGSKATELDNI